MGNPGFVVTFGDGFELLPSRNVIRARRCLPSPISR